MNNLLLPLAIFFTMLFACSTDHSHKHEAQEQRLEALAYTLYTDRTELFVEFRPLIVGQESKFAAHFTKLGEYFKPFTDGTITLTLLINRKSISVKATEPASPGIFRLAITPAEEGVGMLIFEIQTQEFTDKITLDSIRVFADKKTALEDQPAEASGGGISYLKEQAWKVEFANIAIKKQAFNEIIKTSGQILSAPGDESILTANSKGMVIFSANTIIGAEVSAGTPMFTIAGGSLTEGNIDLAYIEAKARFIKIKADFERSTELVKDKIISEKDFLQTKLEFENAEAVYNKLAKNYSVAGQIIAAGMDGFVKNIHVSDGQFVEAGAPLASISKNKKLILQAHVSQKYFDKLPFISSANFKTTESDTFINTSHLNGKVISYGKSIAASTPFIPLTFEIDNIRNLIPGSLAEVYLKTFTIPDAIVIPETAIIEEQGIFFVYVQTAGESFEKREIKTGAGDGINVQVLSGVSEGERVVTKGAYQIKLSSASGTLPAHGHEH